MKDLNKPRFEEEWRKAFEEAELPPNNDVWARLDAHLANEETRKYKNRLIWFQRTAAAILLLLLGGGAWLWMSKQATGPQLAHETGQTSASGPQFAGAEDRTAALSAEATSPTRQAPSDLAEKGTTGSRERTQPATGTGTSPEALVKSYPSTAGRSDGDAGESALNLSTGPALARERSGAPAPGTDQVKRSAEAITGSPDAYLSQGGRNEKFGMKDAGKIPGYRTTPRTPAEAVIAGGIVEGPVTKAVDATEAIDSRLAIAGIAPKTLLAQEPVIRPRSILPYLSEAYWAKVMANEGKAAPKTDAKWDRWQVGLAFAPGAYQPNFRVNEGSSAFMNKVYNYSAANSGSARMDVNSLAEANRDLESATAQGLSYRTGLQLEYALSQRFSIQSGVDYLYNSSSVDTYSYVRNLANGRKEPAFASFLNYENQARVHQSLTMADASPSVEYGSAAPNQNAVALSQASAVIPVRNVYEYVGIPVRVNYKLLTRKLGATLGAGVSGDVFLSNRFGNEDEGIDEIHINSTKGTAYRKWGISAWLGLKMQYRFARKYSVFLEPSYRTAVTSFTNTPALQSRPALFGVGTGLQMLF